ncbi:hypothetical protein [uncultured Ruminococcus sp.]|uniref:hypothetical protein n=1 Tax=uncultured Ruminococcus sp. TaxID=165186 RepID=UPI0025E8254D|nr:hypothetical protein [uncultured Ruminococcus sp.]
MAKKKSITRISDKKRGRPKVRFSIWGMILIFMLSFAACFIVYMVAANINENFWEDNFDKVVVEESSDKAADDNTPVESNESQNDNTQNKISNPIQQSKAKDSSYLDTCCLVTDSTLLGIEDHTELKDVIGSDALNAAGCNTVTIDTSYGNKTAYEILQAKKPEKIYIMLGSDIGTSSVDDMISNYTEFVKNVRGYLTSADIYILQLPPVPESNEKISNSLINEFNTKLLTIANMTGVYCLDTNTALKSVDGSISEEFTDSETGALTEKAFKKIADYILCHTV